MASYVAALPGSVGQPQVVKTEQSFKAVCVDLDCRLYFTWPPEVPRSYGGDRDGSMECVTVEDIKEVKLPERLEQALAISVIYWDTSQGELGKPSLRLVAQGPEHQL